MAQEIVPWIIGGNSLLSIITILYAFFSRDSTRIQKQVDELSETVAALEDQWDHKAEKRTDAIRQEVRDGIRELKETVSVTAARASLTERAVAVVESRLAQMPTQEVVARLEVGLARVEGGVETLTERIRPVAAVATRIQEMALEEARR